MTTDLLRYAITGVGILLSLAVGPCLIWSPGGWDQRVRFVAFIGFGVVIAGGQLDNLGVPPKWTTWAIGLVLLLALVGTAGHLRRVYAAIWKDRPQ